MFTSFTIDGKFPWKKGEFDGLFDDIFNPGVFKGPSPIDKDLFRQAVAKAGFPRADVVEYSDHFTVIVELAGYEKAGIEVTLVAGNELTISGVKPPPTAQEGGTYLIQELARSKFSRTFTLGGQLDHDSIHARFDNGVLFVDVAKRSTVNNKPRKVTIK